MELGGVGGIVPRPLDFAEIEKTSRRRRSFICPPPPSYFWTFRYTFDGHGGNLANITFKYFISCCRIENDLVVKFKLDRTTTTHDKGWRRRKKTLVQSARDVSMPPQFSSLTEAEYLDPKHLGCGQIQPLTCTWLWARDVPMPPLFSSLTEAEYLDSKLSGCGRIQQLTF